MLTGAGEVKRARADSPGKNAYPERRRQSRPGQGNRVKGSKARGSAPSTPAKGEPLESIHLFGSAKGAYPDLARSRLAPFALPNQ